jgi:hypothetical protein
VPVTSGVPQGTVLEPILFLVYINDFSEYLTHSKLRLFADDSIIYKEITCRDDCKKLQSDLDAAARWEADWLMDGLISVNFFLSIREIYFHLK